MELSVLQTRAAMDFMMESILLNVLDGSESYVGEFDPLSDDI